MRETKHLHQYFEPVDIEEYENCLKSFDWCSYNDENIFYPSQDTIYRFLYKIAHQNNKEWVDLFDKYSKKK